MTRELHPYLAQLHAAGLWEPPVVNGAGRPTTNTEPPAASDPTAIRYALTALTHEADDVTRAPEGTRNHRLNTAAFRLGQLAAHGWLTVGDIHNNLTDAALLAGLPPHEIAATITSGVSAGLATPRHGVQLTAADPITPAYVIDPAGHGDGDGVELPATPDRGDNTGDVTGDGEGVSEQDGWPRELIDGDAFIHDAPTTVPAIWGHNDDVLWAEGEPLLLTGPTGTGKTTLGGMLIAGRMGLLGDGDNNAALGLPITPGRRVLVLAMDRPHQIQRAMARLLRGYPRDVVRDRLKVWKGPPPADLAKHPHLLLALAQKVDADTVVLDSLKDAAIGLSSEETGQGIARAMNLCVVNGVECLAYHHQTKRTGNDRGKPNTIADVYGSSWITAGMGSVVLLWGNPGDPIVELTHLKQPAAEVGPFVVEHDHVAGRSYLHETTGTPTELLDLLRSGPSTAAALATWVHGDKADRAAVMKVRRRLDKLVEQGALEYLEPAGSASPGPDGRLSGKPAGRYALLNVTNLTTNTEARELAQDQLELAPKRHVSPGRTEARELARPKHADLARRSTENRKSPGHTEARTKHAEARPPKHAPPPPLRGEGRAVHAGEPNFSNDMTSHVMTSHGVTDQVVCARCYQPKPDLIPAPGGKHWCRDCAYPPDRHHNDGDTHD